VKNTPTVVLALLLALILLNTAATAQPVQSMKLLTAEVGWAQNGQHLYWTTDDGAHWKDIAPPRSSNQSLGGVFFLDTSTGWVVLSHPEEKAEQQFRVAATSDAGATWLSSPIKLPWKRYAEDLQAEPQFFFWTGSTGGRTGSCITAPLSHPPCCWLRRTVAKPGRLSGALRRERGLCAFSARPTAYWPGGRRIPNSGSHTTHRKAGSNCR
jgi:hypothetical protein